MCRGQNRCTGRQVARHGARVLVPHSSKRVADRGVDVLPTTGGASWGAHETFVLFRKDPKFLLERSHLGPHAGGSLQLPASLGRCILRHAIPPLFFGKLCAVRPNLASPDQARNLPRRASHITARPLPTLAARLGIIVQCVKHVGYVPAQPHGSSSGAGFGFWHLSARVGTRRLGRFEIAGGLWVPRARVA